MDDTRLTLVLDGEEVICDILFTHYSEEFEKNYVVFQFTDRDEISAAVFVETDGGEGYFEDVQTDEEWELLDELLEAFLGDLEAEDDDAQDEDDDI
ncbi:MAG: DUF1292 domain-containing protein [Paracholeplasma sp.]|jgi:uncharacterized protein YrzB (UPF0473 family)|uniref:Uncharacterized protein n=1 Tax=Acholeplasma brassicae TaxID=61635 RepID=U4KRT6_9MOLU|nr:MULTISPECIES: DUF1292 domain-containing protein [Paracholeplasma]MDY3196020.1 DUF1292 domain-containing protein [Paracholeplasma sp.]CCV66053.1 hypothetical protein (DUF1292) [Paracholeplasma brassicae]